MKKNLNIKSNRNFQSKNIIDKFKTNKPKYSKQTIETKKERILQISERHCVAAIQLAFHLHRSHFYLPLKFLPLLKY